MIKNTCNIHVQGKARLLLTIRKEIDKFTVFLVSLRAVLHPQFRYGVAQGVALGPSLETLCTGHQAIKNCCITPYRRARHYSVFVRLNYMYMYSTLNNIHI